MTFEFPVRHVWLEFTHPVDSQWGFHVKDIQENKVTIGTYLAVDRADVDAFERKKWDRQELRGKTIAYRIWATGF